MKRLREFRDGDKVPDDAVYLESHYKQLLFDTTIVVHTFLVKENSSNNNTGGSNVKR